MASVIARNWVGLHILTPFSKWFYAFGIFFFALDVWLFVFDICLLVFQHLLACVTLSFSLYGTHACCS